MSELSPEEQDLILNEILIPKFATFLRCEKGYDEEKIIAMLRTKDDQLKKLWREFMSGIQIVEILPIDPSLN